jgi:hypothetical protein
LAGRDFKTFSPEERAAYRGWLYGSTLDWASFILVAVGYPVESLRWFVDAVCGVYQRTKGHYPDGAVPITHSALAKRAQKFRNKAQASELVRRALAADAEWSRSARVMVFDIERPKPRERKGKDKRIPTKYTDYLTPAAVWAQEGERQIKKAETEAWKSSKYRAEKRAEILSEAVGMLPAFKGAAEEELPPRMREERCGACEVIAQGKGDSTPKLKKDCPGHPQTVSEYVAAQQARELAARQRIVDKLAGETLTDADEIDRRLAALEVYYAHSKSQLERDYASARAVLLGMKATRLVTPARFTDPEEVAAEVDERFGTEAGKTGTAEWLFEYKKGNAGVTPSVQADDPLPPPPSSGSNSYKGGREVRR